MTQLWLAYLGAAHLLRDPGTYNKLAKIPLVPFDDLQEGQSGFLVLSTVEGETPLVALSQGEGVHWAAMQRVQEIPTLYQARLPGSNGTALFSIKFADLTPISYATCTLPNRVTLLIVSRDADGPIAVQQFVLVPAGLQAYLPPELQWKLLPVSPLKVVQLISLAQQRFADRKSVAPRILEKDQPVTPMREIWRTLLDAKWTDPILAIVALYDIVRHGAAKASPYNIESVLRNLDLYFSSIPDVAVLHRLLLEISSRDRWDPAIFGRGVVVARSYAYDDPFSRPTRFQFCLDLLARCGTRRCTRCRSNADREFILAL